MRRGEADGAATAGLAWPCPMVAAGGSGEREEDVGSLGRREEGPHRSPRLMRRRGGYRFAFPSVRVFGGDSNPVPSLANKIVRPFVP